MTCRAILLLGVAATLVGCHSAGRREGGKQPRRIQLAHVLTEDSPVHKGMVRMAELVQAKTDGRLSVDIRHSAQLGGEKELIEKVQAGSIQMTKVSSNALEANVDEMGVYALPFLFRDHDHYWRVLEGEIGRAFLDRLESIGLKGLAYYDAGERSFYSRRPIAGAANLKDLEVRVQESPTMIATMKALGAVPVSIKFGPELTQQLEKGERVKAAENNPPSYWLEGHYRSCPYYYLDGHSRAPDVLVMNLRAWNSLDADEQRAVQTSAAESVPYQRQVWQEDSERIYRKLEEKGVRITYTPEVYRRLVDKGLKPPAPPDMPLVELEPFVRAVGPVYDGLSAGRRAWVEKIRAVR